MRAIKAILFEEAPLLGQGLLEFGVGKWLAEVEITRVLELVGVGGAVDDADIAYRADEPAVFGDKGDGYAAVVGPRVGLNIGITPPTAWNLPTRRSSLPNGYETPEYGTPPL